MYGAPSLCLGGSAKGPSAVGGIPPTTEGAAAAAATAKAAAAAKTAAAAGPVPSRTPVGGLADGRDGASLVAAMEAGRSRDGGGAPSAGRGPGGGGAPSGGVYGGGRRARGGMKNSIRFSWRDPEVAALKREDFTRQVIMALLSLTPVEVKCLIDNAQERGFDVTLKTAAIAASVLALIREKRNSVPLRSYEVLDLDRQNFRVVTVQTFDGNTEDWDVAGFLGRYGAVVSGARQVEDSLGYFGGRRQYHMLLGEDEAGVDGLHHPPAYFNFGNDRGYLFYARQPPSCRRCRRVGHTEMACAGPRCGVCGKEGHVARNCHVPKACHFCGVAGHLLRQCPQREKSYAGAAARGAGAPVALRVAPVAPAVGGAVWSVGGVHSSGVGILFGGGGIRVEGSFMISQGRAVGADICVGELKLRVICVYGPQGRVARRELVECVAPHCATNRVLVVGGDFNVELGGTGEVSVAAWRVLFSGHSLVDGGRRTTPHLDGPTWRNSRGVQKRLDYVFLPRSLGPVSGRVLPVFFSDHDGVLLTVRGRVPVFGRGYWRLNLGVLEEQAFCDSVAHFYQGLVGLKPFYAGVVEWWETVKARLRDFIQGHCRRKAKALRAEVARLQYQLELEHSLGNLGLSPDMQRCAALKVRLRVIHERRARAYLLRARQDFLEENETCSASFFASVKAAKRRSVFAGVRDLQGHIAAEPARMVEAATDYYRVLFSAREVDAGCGEVFLSALTRRAPPDVAAAMEAPLSLGELEGALGRMGRRKVASMGCRPSSISSSGM